jgi:Skp family chaperone for outer membrane proteins
MKIFSSVISISLMLGTAAFAQTPAPPAATPAPGAPATRIAVIDFNRAVFECTEGKKAAEVMQGEMKGFQTKFEAAQKEMEALQKEGQQGTTLSDAQKADLTKKIDVKQTELTRINEDAQKAQADMQDKYLNPIAQKVGKVVEAYGKEVGLAAVFDVSTQPSNILYANDVADITTEIIRRKDAEDAKAPAKTTGAPSAPATAPKSATPTGTTPARPTPVPTNK